MNYSAARQPLIDNGYKPIPILPNDKRPAVKNWADPKFVPPVKGYNGHHGVGIVCGQGEYPIAGVDIDITNESITNAVRDYVLEKYGYTLQRVGRQPKTLLLYRHHKENVRKITSKRYDVGRVEILGAGQQYVAYGTHPDTKKPYQWEGILGEALDTPASSLPVLSLEACQDIIRYAEDLMDIMGCELVTKTDDKPKQQDDFDPADPLDYQEPLNIPIADLKAMIDKLDPDCGRDEWRNVGMALHHETNGSPEGLALWDAWSAGGSKYKEGEPAHQWQSFGRYTGRHITSAYILHLVKEKSKPVDPNFFKNLNWSTTRFVDNPAPIPMVIEDMLPKGITSLFYSAGGAGKSTLIMQLAIKIALAAKYKNTEFFGHKVNGGKAVILTAEDPELILNRRFIAFIEALAVELDISFEEVRAAVDENLSIVSTQKHPVQLFRVAKDETLKTTEYFDSLLECLAGIKDLQLVAIDTKTRYSPGEGLGNVLATQEISYYEKMAGDTGASIMLLHHSTKVSRDGSQGGKQAYRDATALYDSVRAAWYLRSLSDDEVKAQGEQIIEGTSFLLLENSKNNYLPVLPDIVIKREGFAYSCKEKTPKLTKVEQKISDAQELYDGVFNLLRSSGRSTFTRQDALATCAQLLSKTKATAMLDKFILDGLLEKRETKIGHLYAFTDTGEMYNATLDGEEDSS